MIYHTSTMFLLATPGLVMGSGFLPGFPSLQKHFEDQAANADPEAELRAQAEEDRLNQLASGWSVRGRENGEAFTWVHESLPDRLCWIEPTVRMQQWAPKWLYYATTPTGLHEWVRIHNGRVEVRATDPNLPEFEAPRFRQAHAESGGFDGGLQGIEITLEESSAGDEKKEEHAGAERIKRLQDGPIISSKNIQKEHALKKKKEDGYQRKVAMYRARIRHEVEMLKDNLGRFVSLGKKEVEEGFQELFTKMWKDLKDLGKIYERPTFEKHLASLFNKKTLGAVLKRSHLLIHMDSFKGQGDKDPKKEAYSLEISQMINELMEVIKPHKTSELQDKY